MVYETSDELLTRADPLRLIEGESDGVSNRGRYRAAVDYLCRLIVGDEPLPELSDFDIRRRLLTLTGYLENSAPTEKARRFYKELEQRGHLDENGLLLSSAERRTRLRELSWP